MKCRRLALILTLFYASCAGTARAADIGEPAPSLVLKDIRYLPRTLGNLRDRSAIVLAFNALEDPESQELREALKAWHTKYHPEGVAIVSVNVSSDDSIMEMAEDALTREAPYLLLKDMEGEAAAALGVTALPAIVLLDGEQRLAYRGTVAAAEQALREVLAGESVTTPETGMAGIPLPLRAVPEPGAPVTFAKQIAPILYENCAECHRPDASAPFSLLSYEQAAAHADMIREVVLEERMPPWYASRAHGGWTNERGLSEEEKLLIAQWVQGGRLEGNPEDAPARPQFPETEWQIETPDLVLSAPEPFDIPASGYVPYRYVTLPYQFPADTFIQGIEIQPGNKAVVHHANLVFSLPDQAYDGDQNFLTGYVPGGRPAIVPGPIAYCVPKDAVLTLQIHYVTTGKPEQDQMRVGIRYARGSVLKKLHYTIVRPENEALAIPPGEAFFRIAAERTLNTDALPLALFSHMHLRGRDMSFVAEYPDGARETLLVVPNYSFDWQLAYLYPPGAKEFPRGTTIRTVSHYDNSTFNPYNPDPHAEVIYGPQTIHEMNDAYVFYLDKHEQLNLSVDPETGQALEGHAQPQHK